MTTPVQVTLNLVGALETLGAVMHAAQDLTPVLEGPINKSVDTLFLRQFASEGSYGGTRWAPDAPVTVKLRGRRGHGRGGVLRDTNVLWASLTKLGLGPNAVRLVTPHSLTRGTSVKYARYHQTGYVAKTFVVIDRHGNPVPLYRKTPKRIPARPILPDPIPNALVNTWAKTISDFIVSGGTHAT